MNKEEVGYVTVRYLHQEETEDSLHMQVFYENFNHEDVDFEFVKINKDNYSYAGVASPIKIENLQTLIAKANHMGATHLELMYHTDHDGYVVNIVESRPSTQEEINEFKINNSKTREAFLEKKKDELQKKIDQIDLELKDYK